MFEGKAINLVKDSALRCVSTDFRASIRFELERPLIYSRMPMLPERCPSEYSSRCSSQGGLFRLLLLASSEARHPSRFWRCGVRSDPRPIEARPGYPG